MLRERLRSFIDPLDSPLKEDVEAALEKQGKLLCPSSDAETSSRPHGMWALLPFLIIKDLNADYDIVAASNVAIAVECLICALDLLDDIEDGDQTAIVLQIGAARVLNVSTTLLLLAQGTLLALADFGIASERIITLADQLRKATLDAATGQHEDIVSEQQDIAHYMTEDCIRIARGKAGSLMRLACTLGCVFAEAEVPISILFAELGELLGIAHQLDNDSHDLHAILHDSEQEAVKSDLKRQKKTLPFVLAAHQRASQQITPHTPQLDINEQQKAFLNSLHEGIVATWGISLLYRERARDCLQKIETQRPLSHELRLLLGFA